MSNNVNEQKIKCESSFNELNKRFDINDVRFDELKSDINNMKLQNVNVDKRLNNIDERFQTIIKRMKDDVDDIRKRMESRESKINVLRGFNIENRSNEILENKTIGSDNEDNETICGNENINKEATVNKVSENNGNTNNNGVSLSVKQVTVNKVSNKVNYDVKQVFEKVVSKNDTVNSDNENRMRVEVNYGVLVKCLRVRKGV